MAERAAPQEGCRPAVPSDLPRLAALAAQAVTELRAGRGGEVWARREARQPPYEPRLEHQLSDPDHHVVVGTLDEHVLGYAVVHLERLHDGGVLGIVDDLYTEPEARELGVGEAMMDRLVEWCAARSCFGIDALALPGDRHTKNFFESFGLVARGIVVHRALP